MFDGDGTLINEIGHQRWADQKRQRVEEFVHLVTRMDGASVATPQRTEETGKFYDETHSPSYMLRKDANSKYVFP